MYLKDVTVGFSLNYVIIEVYNHNVDIRSISYKYNNWKWYHVQLKIHGIKLLCSKILYVNVIAKKIWQTYTF